MWKRQQIFNMLMQICRWIYCKSSETSCFHLNRELMGYLCYLTVFIDVLHCSAIFQALKSMLWASLSRLHQMQPMLRSVNVHLSCLPFSCGCCLFYAMLCLLSERKGVHWKTQHDISTGEVCLTAEEFIAIHYMMMWVYTFDDCNKKWLLPFFTLDVIVSRSWNRSGQNTGPHLSVTLLERAAPVRAFARTTWSFWNFSVKRCLTSPVARWLKLKPNTWKTGETTLKENNCHVLWLFVKWAHIHIISSC